MASSDVAVSPGRPRRASVRRPILLAIAAVLLTLAGIAAARIGPLLFAPNRYAGTPSIEQTASYRDPGLLSRAWALPAAAAYRRGGFVYQSNPSFCGPASIANVIRSLGGRMNQEQVVANTRYEPWFGILLGGLTLDEAADLLALRLKRRVQPVRAPDLATFRALLRRSNDPSVRMIVNFHRGPLFGRGHGHLSPILGYLEREDLVLVGDVNADYRPFLVSSERLLGAMRPVDSETGQARGLIVASGLADK
jgi:hypothetical protein